MKEFEDIFAQDVVDLKQLRQQAFNGKLVYIFNIIIIDYIYYIIYIILIFNPQVYPMCSVSVL